MLSFPVIGINRMLLPRRAFRAAAPLALSAAVWLGFPAAAGSATFEAWLSDLRQEALGRGIGTATLDAALTGLEPNGRVIELDRRQPEFTLTFWQYLDRYVTAERVATGRKKWVENKALLQAVQDKYGVPARFLVAFWGVETDFGRVSGGFPVIQSLATLAYDGRRSDFFRGELMHALRIVEGGHIAVDRMLGSWAGAMGQCQFMPSTFTGYAVDHENDGRIDIWGNEGDVFASAANYLSRVGWSSGETWGREVRLPDGFEYRLADLKVKKSLAEWQALGVRRIDGSDLPRVAIQASVVLPDGAKGPAFVVYNNFRTTMIWNRSVFYAIAVGHLADRLIGKTPLKTPRPANDVGLGRADVIALQQMLGARGYDVGKPDGLVGSRTRAAVRAYQIEADLPADGHPTVELIDRLRAAAGAGGASGVAGPGEAR